MKTAKDFFDKHVNIFLEVNKQARFDDIPNTIFYNAMEDYANYKIEQANGAKSKDGKLPIPHVVGQSEQLVCPDCKGKNIEILHKSQTFKCKD